MACLEGARDSKSPVIIQVSQGGAAFFGGKGLANKNQEGSIAGATAAAHYIRAIAPAYGMSVERETSPSTETCGAAQRLTRGGCGLCAAPS